MARAETAYPVLNVHSEGLTAPTAFLEMLATILQSPKSFSRHLQRPCKLQKVFRSTCSVPANAEKFFEALAAFLQTPKSSSRRLQHSCKRQKVFRGTCSVPANAKKFFAAFAAFLQRPKSFSGHLQHFCKRQNFIFRFARLLQRLTSPSPPRISHKKEAESSPRFDRYHTTNSYTYQSSIKNRIHHESCC